ncbi:hypothetical protein Patl1_11815 [Pistacia atlantica]|uniref:Uncharacterized protein n=1 Tax=Pistacia atlantica TaxID=434234 RepID=A0ACC1A4F0_9ROSI|nr:hypothetical protein Patl1_11815 [Pistacia atlantica]
MAEVSPSSVQLIAGNGDINVDDLGNFVRATKLPDRGLSYTVIAIMGPKSTGKSTLMNNLFDTNFNELGVIEGRSQTTKGIWIDKCADIYPFTIAMDLEGIDAWERGEDDTAFEKRSALFAVAIADVVLINFYACESRPGHSLRLPKVMMRLFRPRKTTLPFVIRDKTKIWEAVPKPQHHESAPLSEFFNVEVTALSSYEEKEEEFKEQGGLAGDRQGVFPASGFSFSVQQIWKLIKENKDLDLPALKVLVATFRCGEIANEKLRLLSAYEGWLALEEAIQVGPVPGFGKKLSSVLDTYLSNDSVGVFSLIQLCLEALNLILVFDSFKISLEQLPNEGEGFAAAVRTCLQSCVLEFDQGCADRLTGMLQKPGENLRRDVYAHASLVCRAKLSEIKANYEVIFLANPQFIAVISINGKTRCSTY